MVRARSCLCPSLRVKLGRKSRSSGWMPDSTRGAQRYMTRTTSRLFLAITSVLVIYVCALVSIHIWNPVLDLKVATASGAGTRYPGLEIQFTSFPVLVSALIGVVVIVYLYVHGRSPSSFDHRILEPTPSKQDGTLDQRPSPNDPDPTHHTVAPLSAITPELLAVSLVAFLTAYVYSSPPHLWQYLTYGNFRSLWVDPVVGWSSPWKETLYFLPNLIKSTFLHFFPVEATPFFVSTCQVISALLFFDCCRQLQFSSWLRLAATFSYIFSSHLMIFYQPAEDVTLLNVFSLFVVNAYLRRNMLAFALATSVLLLSRLQALTLPMALFVADSHYKYATSKGSFRKRLFDATVANRFLVVSGILTVGVVGAFHLTWLYEGIHFLQVTSVTSADFQPPKVIDGLKRPS